MDYPKTAQWYLNNDYEVLTRDGDGNPLMYKNLEEQ